MQVKLTEGLADFVVGSDLAEVKLEAFEKAKKVIADSIAAILSGAGSELAPPLLAYSHNTSVGKVPLLGTHLSSSSATAALINGSFGAALDFDDVLSMIPGHPAAVIIPALVSVSYDRQVDGSRFIDAYIVGLELGSKLSQGVGLKHYFNRGFHATGSVVVFCAVGALARLLNLSPDKIRQAMGIAASTAGGLQANFGTMTKPFHSGWAAQSAIIAIDLVQKGFTASKEIFEAKGGYFQAYGTEESDLNNVLPLLCNPWTILSPGIALKKFATCYATQRGIDGVVQIEKKIGPIKDNLEKLVCKVAPGALLPLRYTRPISGLEGKFSMQYNLAAIMLDGTIKIDTFTDEAVQRSEIHELYKKIEVYEDEACVAEDPNYKAKSAGTRGFVLVEVVLKDGTTDKFRVDLAPGHPERELSWEDLHTKFIDCADYCKVGRSEANQVFEKLRVFEDVDDIGNLLAKLRPAV